jgi:uncharacterized protein with GYD domain
MGQYVILGNFTDKALGNLKAADEMGQGAQQAAEAMGGKILHNLTTFGQYDFVIIAEMPSDEAMLELAFRAASTGMFKTQILKGFPEDVTDPMIAKL